MKNAKKKENNDLLQRVKARKERTFTNPNEKCKKERK